MENIAAVSIRYTNPSNEELLTASEAAKLVTHIQNEMALHIDYCKDFGVSKEEMEAAEESEGRNDSPSMKWQLKGSA